MSPENTCVRCVSYDHTIGFLSAIIFFLWISPAIAQPVSIAASDFTAYELPEFGEQITVREQHFCVPHIDYLMKTPNVLINKADKMQHIRGDLNWRSYIAAAGLKHYTPPGFFERYGVFIFSAALFMLLIGFLSKFSGFDYDFEFPDNKGATDSEKASKRLFVSAKISLICAGSVIVISIVISFFVHIGSGIPDIAREFSSLKRGGVLAVNPLSDDLIIGYNGNEYELSSDEYFYIDTEQLSSGTDIYFIHEDLETKVVYDGFPLHSMGLGTPVCVISAFGPRAFLIGSHIYR